MSDPERFPEAMEVFRKIAEQGRSEADASGGYGLPPPPPIEPPPDGGDPPDMDGIAALKADLEALKRTTSSVQTSIERMTGLFDGFKDSLRSMQWALGIMLAFGLAAIGWLVAIGNARVGEISTRLDRFLERQAEATASANARFDRLIEQRATAPTAPIVIQVPQAAFPPGAVPPTSATPDSPAPGR